MDCKFSNHNRPIVRGSFARTLYERMLREQQLRNYDRNKWYKCNIHDPFLKKTFVQLHYDHETELFIENCYEKSNWFFTHLFNAFARALLCLFMSSTSINGLLKRGSMFVFSDSQLNSLCEMTSFKCNKNSTLLDLGAGDGEVTATMQKYFSRTYCTEISPIMRKILAKKGYYILDAENWHSNNDLLFDFISCLNLLDRCDKPLTMLSNIKSKLKNNGRILIAIVLPLNQYVELSYNDHKPSEVIPISGSSIEEQIESFNDKVIKPNGLCIIKWSKLPYLCEGDLDLSFYWLNDVIFLLKRIEDS